MREENAAREKSRATTQLYAVPPSRGLTDPPRAHLELPNPDLWLL